MALYDPSNSPEQNLAILSENEYPGRLLVVGFVGSTTVIGCAIEGRRPDSQNRRYICQDGIISTETVDPTLGVIDPELTIYDAMRSVGEDQVVSNGVQTDRVVRFLRSGRTFAEAMEVTEPETDVPIFTSRITAAVQYRHDPPDPLVGISVISRDRSDGTTIRKLYTQDSPELEHIHDYRVGYAVHTYQGDPGDGSPPLSFDEPPFRIPVSKYAEEMADMLWHNLRPKNRVAVAAKTITNYGAVDIARRNLHE